MSALAAVQFRPLIICTARSIRNRSPSASPYWGGFCTDPIEHAAVGDDDPLRRRILRIRRDLNVRETFRARMGRKRPSAAVAYPRPLFHGTTA